MFLKCGMGGHSFTTKLYGPTMLVTPDLQMVGTIKCSSDNDDLPVDKVKTSDYKQFSNFKENKSRSILCIQSSEREQT